MGEAAMKFKGIIQFTPAELAELHKEPLSAYAFREYGSDLKLCEGIKKLEDLTEELWAAAFEKSERPQ
jgi:hypothetical protein